MNYFRIIIAFQLFLFSTLNMSGQAEPEPSSLRFYLSEDGSSYAGIVMVNQIWSRYIWHNPDADLIGQSAEVDFSIRRSRLILYTYLMDRVFIYTQIGHDGLNYRTSGNPQISMYNAQTEYIFLKDKLHVGFGLNTWNGLSRYNNSKLLEFLVIDSPGFAYPVGGSFDRFGRQIGIYAKGTVNKLHYRMAVVKPFETGVELSEAGVSAEPVVNNNLAVKGYFTWQFFDKENHLFPYMTMNNLGKARFFNLGAGFYFHPDAMGKTGSGQAATSDIFLFALDAFLDIPAGVNGGAVTSNLGYYNYDFGPDYIRSSGTINVGRPGIQQALPQGHGNSEWDSGTGTIVHGELGYLIAGRILNSRFQPYGALTHKNFEALDEASLQYGAGLNILMYNHNIKWTMQYMTRPIYDAIDNRQVVVDQKGQFILQTQIVF
jgi:hypothetical protein